MEHTKHLWRAIIILVVILVGYLLGRGFLVPKSFGEYGYYRGDNVKEQMNVTVPRYGSGVQSCAYCHDDKVKTVMQSAHKVINCETCHAPLKTHVDYPSIEAFLADPSKFKRTAKMEIHTAQELCVRCHDRQLAKPADFKTVVVVEHLKEQGMENDPNVCLECHDPHDPEM